MKLLLGKLFLDTSMNLFILNESRGGYKSSFGLCVGLIGRDPTCARLLNVSLLCSRLEYKLLSIWIPGSMQTGFQFFPVFQSNHIKHKIKFECKE